MAEPEWLELQAVLILHERSLGLHGGAPGLRDLGLLESALARPRNRFLYEGVEDLADLAATYAVAISGNHPFADGNKRAVFSSMALFLALNGPRLRADEADAAKSFFALAAGEVDVDQLAAWIRDRLAI